jgi:hypothetical protein
MARPLSHKAFLEGFPMGVVAIARQKNGKYRLIVSRPPNDPDPILADAEKQLYELVEDRNAELTSKTKKKPYDVDEGDEDDED